MRVGHAVAVDPGARSPGPKEGESNLELDTQTRTTTQLSEVKETWASPDASVPGAAHCRTAQPTPPLLRPWVGSRENVDSGGMRVGQIC